jgi:1-acyl-sn-glycerol-3-phosphate acyltransferase
VALFAWHAERRVAARFGALRISGLERLREAGAAGPLVVVSNHTSWWDPMLALVLGSRAGLEGYALMEAANLRRLPFFALVGAFGLDPADPSDAAAGLRYAARLLSPRGGGLPARRAVWVFPQGREVPAHARPLGFQGGAAALSRLSGAPVLPVALAYTFGSVEAPTAWISVGEPLQPGADAAAQEEAVSRELDRIQAAVEGSDRPFGPPPHPDDGFAARALAWLTAWAIRRPSARPARSDRSGRAR